MLFQTSASHAIIICTLLLSLVFSADASPVKLASNGVAGCPIVISTEATDAEKYAAKELAHFLDEITGTKFQIIDDSKAVSGPEIVLGNTNRLSFRDLPKKLRPTKQEGFAILCRGDSIFIIGAIPRATLYGVYDMLEMELGCRFLALGVNYIPKQPDLQINIKSRKYDPPLEYRCVWSQGGDEWQVRSKLNGKTDGLIPMEEMLGGVRWINPWFVHTFVDLVPWEKYAKEHPEYYSLIDGRRSPYVGEVKTQLCLTNPDVYEITLRRVREIIDQANKTYSQARYSKLLVSISENDNLHFCQCKECRKVNEEENCPNGGTLIRFINRIAKEIGKDHKNVEVETLVYGMMTVPPKSRPESNVLIRWCSRTDDGYPMDSKANRKVYDDLLKWRTMTNRIYHWGYYTNFGDYFMPYPQLDYIGHNMRMQIANGVLGMFIQNAPDPGAEFQQLRCYLFARCMWRPETDVRKATEEFCKLYYGKGDEKVLEYIRYLNDNYRGAFKPQDFDDAFIQKANGILAEAERLADTPEIKQRVAVARLPIWKLMIDRALPYQGAVADLPIEWKFCFDESNVGTRDQWFTLTDFSSWKPIRTDSSWVKQGEKRFGVGWYATEFEMPAGTGDYMLRFGAVDGLCDIFIDGKHVGAQKVPPHIMWNTPFSIRLPEWVTPGKHKLVVRVEKDAWDAGIWKPVKIVDAKALLSQEIREACERFISVGSSVPIKWLFDGHPGMDAYYQSIKSMLELGRTTPAL